MAEKRAELDMLNQDFLSDLDPNADSYESHQDYLDDADSYEAHQDYYLEDGPYNFDSEDEWFDWRILL